MEANQIGSLGGPGKGKGGRRVGEERLRQLFFSFFPAVKALTDNLSHILMVLQLAGKRAICLLIQLACLFISGGREGAVTGQTVPVSYRLLSGWEDDREWEHPTRAAPANVLITILSQAF